MMDGLRVWVAACILGLAWHPTRAAEIELGRLFHTPEERAALDVARRQSSMTVPRVLAAQPDAPSAPPAPHLDGTIQRAGKPVAEWVDGTLRTAPAAPVRVPAP